MRRMAIGRRSPLRMRGMTAPFVLDGAINGSMFLAYVKRCIVPTLNAATSSRWTICRSIGLPALRTRSKPRCDTALPSAIFADLNPIKQAFSKLKAHLRRAAEHTIPGLMRRIGRIVRAFSPKECRNFFRHAGYVSNMTGIRSSCRDNLPSAVPVKPNCRPRAHI